MARPHATDDPALIARLGDVFQQVGFSGASLALLAQASGLKKASLYHRFPGGKQQMAEQVLDAAAARFTESVIAPLQQPGDPHARLAKALQALDAFYVGGTRACLLNMLATPSAEDATFRPRIASALSHLLAAFAALAAETGVAQPVARRRAERAVMLIQGSLVMARGLASPTPFRTMLTDLPKELLG